MESEDREPRRDEIDAVITAAVRGSMSRREFVRRATVLGVGATMIASVLAACGDDDDDATTEAPATSAAPETSAAAESSAAPETTAAAETSAAETTAAETTAAETTEAAGGEYVVPQFDGTKVNLLVVAEGPEKGVADKVGEIKDMFGIDLEFTALAVGPLLEKANQSLQASEGTFDLITVLGFSVSQMVGGDNFELLNPYMEDPTKLPPDFDFADFPAGQTEYVGYYDIPNGQFGGDQLYLIPGLHGGSIVTFYRTDLMDAAGLTPPVDLPGWLAAAEAMNKDGVAGTSMIAKSGDVSLFLVDWWTRFTALNGELMSGSPQSKDFTPNLTSEQAVGALQNMIDCLPFSAAGVTQYDFTASVDAFAAGKTAMMLMWSTIGGTVYNPDSSTVADKINVAIPPGGRPVRGGWGTGIPKNSQNKDAAFAVLTYLTGKEFGIYQTGTYQTDPSRNSVYNDPGLVAELPYLPVAGEAFDGASILPLAQVPETFEIITACAEEFGLALSGSGTAAEACAKAQDRTVEILQRGGWLA